MKKLSLLLMLVFGAMTVAFAQMRTITGTVVDENGDPAIGVNVYVKSAETIGTETDIDGKFSLDVPEKTNKIVFSYLGYADIEKDVTNTNTVGVVNLSLDAEVIEEVVVVGYNSVKRSDITTAVETVDGEELQTVTLGSVDQQLQGKAAGVDIIAANGRPGGTAYVRIRGNGSDRNNEPLFILDGVQITASAYNQINPNDIETISVLKDAGATSIYGAAASNGVVLITTKKGSGLRPRVEYNTQYGFKEMVDDNIDMMDAAQKLQYEQELGQGPEANATPERQQFLIENSVDWQEVLLQTGTFQQHNLGISGGTEKADVFASFSYWDEEGIVINGTDFQRYTGRFNTNFEVNNWLTIGNTLTTAYTFENELRDRNNVQNPFRAMYDYDAYEPLYVLDEDGNPELDENGDPIFNLTSEGFPIAEALINNPETVERITIIGSAYARADITDNLFVRGQYNLRYLGTENVYWNKPGSVLDGYIYPVPTGSVTLTETAAYQQQVNTLIGYNRTFADKHNTTFLAGTEFIDYDFARSQTRGRGFPNDQLYTLDNAAEIFGGTSSREEYAVFSYFGQATYNYDSRYFATASIRRDGASRFGADNRYGTFGAVSAGWNIASESFLQSFEKLDQLKLRTSYGTSGNYRSVGFYAALDQIGAGSYNNLPSLFPAQLENRDLQWESNRSFSVGLDFGLFNNRVSGALDYYTRSTFDLLFFRPLPNSTGFNGRDENVGEIQNEGVEFQLAVDLVRGGRDGFNWSVFGNISTNENRVIELENDGEEIFDSYTILQEGQEFKTFYLVRWAGVDPATGDPLFLDADGNVTNEYSSDYAVALEGKSPFPSYYGGFGTNASFKGFDLGVNFTFRGGNYIYNAMASNMLSDGANINDNQRVEALDYWKEPGDITEIPRPFYQNVGGTTTDRFLQRGDFLRLRNATVGYSLPLDNVSAVQRARVYVSGTNLLTFTAYEGDPEVGIGSGESNLTLPGEIALYSYPTTSALIFGLDVTF